MFVQMEDEIASMAAVIGASMGGVKAMTATSGPGFSLKQENLGYAAGAEIPCVIVNVMRGGPSTGMPTRPSQADLMQARWGSHGDYPIIVLTPASVGEIYSETIRAFDLAEQLPLAGRAALRPGDRAAFRNRRARRRRQRRAARNANGRAGRAQAYQPYAAGDDGIPAMARPGAGYRVHTTGLTHGERRLPDPEPGSGHPQPVAAVLQARPAPRRDRLLARRCAATTPTWSSSPSASAPARRPARSSSAARRGCASGCSVRSRSGRFPNRRCAQAAAKARAVLVPEMNTGQLRLEVERVLGGSRSTACICSAARRSRRPKSPRGLRRSRRRHDVHRYGRRLRRHATISAWR